MTSQPRDYFGDRLTPAEREAKRRAREERQQIENRRLGLLVFQVSWIMAFVSLIIVNWQLRFSYETWPPPGVQALGVMVPTVATLLLFVSVVLARRARRQVQADEAFTGGWLAAIGLAATFVLIMVYEWLRVDTGTQYSAVFRLMTGFHSLHAVAVGAFMVNIWRNARHARRVDAGKVEDDGRVVRYNSENFWSVEAASKMLDFVFIAWLLFYVVLYWWRT